MTEVAAQGAQFGGQRGDALISRSRIRAGRAGIGDRVGQARGVGIRTGRHRDRLGRWRRAGARAARKGQRAPPQRGDIPATEAPARTGEHPHRRRTGRRVGDQPQHCHHVGDLGDGQQTGQPDDLDRDSAGAKRIGDGCGIGVAAHQYRGGRRADAVSVGSPVMPVQHGRRSTRVRPAHREATHSGQCRAGHPGAGATHAPQPIVAAPPPRWRWPPAGRAAGCASWSAAPGPARGCRRSGGSRW